MSALPFEVCPVRAWLSRLGNKLDLVGDGHIAHPLTTLITPILPVVFLNGITLVAPDVYLVHTHLCKRTSGLSPPTSPSTTRAVGRGGWKRSILICRQVVGGL